MDLKEMKSNPFDVLFQSAIEFARSALFFNSRYRNTEYMDVQDMNDLEIYSKRVEEQFEILKVLSQDEVDALRRMSYCSMADTNRINQNLYALFNDIRTEYSESFPFVSVEFEEFTLGVDSDEFKRRAYLRKLCDTNKKLTDSLLKNCFDYRSHGEEKCRETWGSSFTDEVCNTIRELLDENKLQDWELDYMISYIEHR